MTIKKDERRINRREFLKKTGSGAAGIVVIGMAPGFAWARKKKPIIIGASLSLTGKYARGAEEQKRGYELWAEHVNTVGYSLGKGNLSHKERGLIDGRPVEFILLDDRSDPTTGVRLFNELIYNRKVDFLLGPYSSSVSNAVAPVIEEAKMPTPIPMASSPKIWKGKGRKWMTQIMPPGHLRLPGIVKMCKEKGDKTIAIIYSDAAFPRSGAEGLKERAEKYGLKTVLYEAYPKTLTDWIPIVTKAKDRKAQVLAGGGYLPDSIGIVKAAKSINYVPHAISLLVGVALPDFKDSLGNDALNITGDAGWEVTVKYPGAKGYTEAYRKKYGAEPEYHSAGAYGGAQVLEEAIKRVGNVKDRKTIRDVMYSLDTLTIFNRYSVMPLDSPDSGLQVGGKNLLLQWQRVAGELKKVVIYPPDAAVGKFIYPFQGWQ